MFILFISTLVSVWIFGLYAIIHIDEHQKKLQIHKKLIESLQESVDSLEEKHQDLVDDLHTI